MAFGFETENFVVRESVFSDYEYYWKWENDTETVKYLAIDKDKSYESVVTEGFAYRADKSVIDCSIVDKAKEEPLGRIIIGRIDGHHKSLDISKIYVGGNRRGQGIGREVFIGMLKYFFEELGMARVTLDHFAGNVKAAALYERLGFVREGVAREACVKDGVYFDLHLMSMLREEYFEKYPSV